MKTRKEKGMELFVQGYNCSQSVVLAYADVLGLEPEQLAKLSASFGGGLARLRHVCGTVSGMAMVAGWLTGMTEPGDQKQKKENYDTVQKLAAEFEKRNGSIICRELLGLDTKHSSVGAEYQTGVTPEPRTEEYYKKRPCKALVGEACEILEEYFGLPLEDTD